MEDETADLTLVFFRAKSGWVEKALPLGAIRWVSGLVEIFDFYKQMVHPDRILDEKALAERLPEDADIHEALAALREDYATRGVNLARAGSR